MDLLKQWGLDNLISAFEEQKVDSLELFESLTQEDLLTLIPILGERKTFEKKLKQHLNENPRIDYDTPVIVRIEPAYAASDEPPLKKAAIEFNEDVSEPSCYQSDAGSSSWSVTSAEGLNLYVSHTEMANFNLLELLQNHILGRSIINKHVAIRKLDNKDRNNICEIIICHFLNQGKKLSNGTISMLADKLVEIFDTERKSTYFVSPISKKRSTHNKPEIAKGKLIDKHRNKLTMLRKSLKFTSTNSLADGLEVHEHTEAAQYMKDSEVWLRNNIEPHEEVLKHWKRSYPLRKSTCDFQRWPILQETEQAIELIEYDYQQKFPTDTEHFDLQAEFDGMFEKVLRIRKDLLKPCDEIFVENLRSELTTDSKTAIKLYLLASLVPPKGRFSGKGKKQWKPSISESRDGLFLQAKGVGDLGKLKKEKVDLLYSKGLTVQPYIVFQGTSLNNIVSSYVVLNDKYYKTSSAIQAIKFCLESCMVLDFQYSFECRHLWYLIQWEVFKLRQSGDPKIPYVSDITA